MRKSASFKSAAVPGSDFRFFQQLLEGVAGVDRQVKLPGKGSVCLGQPGEGFRLAEGLAAGKGDAL